MTVIIVLILVLIGLFVGSFLSKRRFGVLGLGLAAGAIISPIWGDTAGYVVSSTGFIKEGPLIAVIALSLLILLPAILFMFHGYSYSNIFERIIGSLLFTILAAAFLIGPISAAITFTGPVAGVYDWLNSHHNLIVSIGVALAVVDFLIARPAHKSEKKRR